MKKHFFNIFIHPFTVIYIAIALFTGRFSFLFIHLFVAFIHEMFHVIMALLWKVRVTEITMLPFGFYAQMERVEKKSFWAQICIYLAGPLSIFFSLFLMRLFYQFSWLSFYGYQYGIEACYVVCFFNLVPIYPLDGGRIMRLLCYRWLEEEKARVLSYILSIIAATFIFYRAILCGQWVIIIFILISQVQWIMSEKKQYLHFLRMRKLEKKPKKIKISSSPSLYLYYDNYFLDNDKMYGEDEILMIKQEKWRKKHKKKMGSIF